jgi:AraC family transcriptional regulator of arabinose operon
MPEHLVVAPRPAVSAAIADVSVDAVGHFPRRLHPGTDARFPRESLVFIVAGAGAFCADGGASEPVGPGSMWFLRPGVHYRYGPEPGGWWEEYFIDLSGGGLARWHGRGWLPRAPRVHWLAEPASAHAQLRALFALQSRGGAGAADRAVLATARLLVDRAAAGGPPAPADPPELLAALEALHQRYASRIDWRRLAREHLVSYTALRRGLRRLTGQPPARYLAQLRVEAAMRLLHETRLGIKEIARIVGIPHPVSFHRAFARHARVGPRAYRQAVVRATQRSPQLPRRSS